MDFSTYNDFFKIIGFGHLNSMNYEMNYRPVDSYGGYVIQLEFTTYIHPEEIDESGIEKITEIVQLYNNDQSFRKKVDEYLVKERLK